jgi:hypothetical protein
MNISRLFLSSVLSLLALPLVCSLARADTIVYSQNFDNSSAAPGFLNGTTAINSGGSNGTPSVQLTADSSNQTGALILPNLVPGGSILSFTSSFDLQIGPSSSPNLRADGLSFVFGQLSDTSLFGEEGPTEFNGLTISFDTFNNNASDPAPSIEVR